MTNKEISTHSKIRRLLASPIFLAVIAGLSAGLIGSILDSFFLFVVIPLSLVVFFLMPRREARRVHIVVSGLGILIATIAVCVAMPVKTLDRKSGPFEFQNVSMAELCMLLNRDYQIPAHLTVYDERRQKIVSFAVTKRMSKRDILNKLASEQGFEFEEGYCGTGASILFGGYPSFCTLKPKAAGGDRR